MFCTFKKALCQVILYVDLQFNKVGIQDIDQVFMTECPFCLAKKLQISQLGIFEEQFAKDRQRKILLVYYLDNYQHPDMIYVNLASLELQSHKLVKLNICHYYISIFEQLGR